MIRSACATTLQCPSDAGRGGGETEEGAPRVGAPLDLVDLPKLDGILVPGDVHAGDDRELL
jgi:hypothetical protein